jgi:hypothetical protein
MSKTIQVVLSDEEHSELMQRAESEGRKKSNMARKLIKDGLRVGILSTEIKGSDLLINLERSARRRDA